MNEETEAYRRMCLISKTIIFLQAHKYTYIFMTPKYPVKNLISIDTTGHQTKLTSNLSLQCHKNWMKR